MRIFLPNSANLQNITGILAHLDLETEPDVLEFAMHHKWVAVHPVVLSMAACLAARVRSNGGSVVGEAAHVRTLPYLIRMGLFNFLGIDPGKEIVEHEEAGRFVPITQIRTAGELTQAITNLIPLLHAPPEVADPIRYVFSEMVRNVLEHSESPVGAFVSAQYYRQTQKISIGIADCGIGVRATMGRFHKARTSEEAIRLALQPGITGTTARIGGTQFNAGAGLFFTKCISVLSRNRFVLYSGDSLFRLNKTRKRHAVQLYADPANDPHTFVPTPQWQGTIVGKDLNVEQGVRFADLLGQIRSAYHIDVKRRRDYTAKIRFT